MEKIEDSNFFRNHSLTFSDLFSTFMDVLVSYKEKLMRKGTYPYSFIGGTTV